MNKKAIIIGAGLTGLSAGIYLQEKGIETEIFELAGQAGGMCTAWERGGYRFDGCIHWMVGTKPGDDFNDLYLEVGALTKDTPIYNADFIRMEVNGVLYDIPLRFAPFKEFLLSLSPRDGKMIDELCGNIEIMMNTKMPAGAPTGISDLFGMLKDSRGFLGLAQKYVNLSVEDYVERFESPVVKAILYNLMPRQFTLVGLFMMLGTRMSGNAGYPLGGAYDLIRRIESKYRSLGGIIHFRTKANEIVVKNGRTVGVRANGDLYEAGAVIAACDMYDTLRNMLGGNYKHKQLDEMLDSSELFDPIVVVSFGLKRRFDIPYSLSYECPEGIETAPGMVQNQIFLHSFDFDPSAAPEGGSSVMIMLGSQLDYWQKLRRENEPEYKNQKQRLALAVADAIDKRIPGFKDAIAVTDVATPATYVRYANLYKGSWEGFAPTPKAIKTNIKTTVDGVKGLILAGQWTTAGGGICTAVKSGKDAARAAQRAL